MMNNLPFKPSRLVSVDVFRALTMLTMIFVNDLYSVSGVPHWMEHAAFDEDMLGFSDLVFPAFLVVMGMSIPLAIETKLQKGESKLTILEGIIFRSFALILMGLFTVNYSSISIEGISKPVYGLLMLSAFALVWNLYPENKTNKSKIIHTSLKYVGVIALILLIYIYRDETGGLFQQRWWGILGLIGWAYSFCAIIYLYWRNRPSVLIVAYISFVVLNILGSNKWLGPFQGLIPDNGCFQAFAMTGLLITLILKHQKIKYTENYRILFCILIGFGLLLLGFVSHQYWIISKIQATPTWLFYSSGIATLLYIAVLYLTDIKNKGVWFCLIKPAGTATLTCYLVSYLLYAIFSITGFTFPEFLLVSPLGLLKCLLVAFTTIGLTSLLGKVGVRLKI